MLVSLGIAEIRQYAVAHVSRDEPAIALDQLIESKALTKGHFMTFLETEFGWTVKTAERYMAAAEVADVFDNLSKTEVLDDFPVSALYLLGQHQVPKPVVEDIIKGAERGKPQTLSGVKRQIATLRGPRKPKTAVPGDTIDSSASISRTLAEPIGSASDVSGAPDTSSDSPVAELESSAPSESRFHIKMNTALAEMEQLSGQLVDLADRNPMAVIGERTLLIGLDRLRVWLAERARKPH
jgi:hypothetical protein